jgi:hypothetical protein
MKVTALYTVKKFVMVDVHGHFQTFVLFIQEQVCAKKCEIQYTQISPLTSHTVSLYLL